MDQQLAPQGGTPLDGAGFLTQEALCRQAQSVTPKEMFGAFPHLSCSLMLQFRSKEKSEE